MPTAWPTLAEATAKLTALGVAVPSDLQTILDGAVLQWEQATNWKPFLAETVDSTTLFDPPAWNTGLPRELDLRGGYTSFTSVTIQRIDGAGGTVLTAGSTGYYKYPQTAPYTWLKFPFVVDGPPQSVEIVGKRGYSATIPADAWKAVLDLAIAEASADSTSGGDMQKIKQGGVEVTYGVSALSAAQTSFNQVAARYRRITF